MADARKTVNSVSYKTKADIYDLLPGEECVRQAKYNEAQDVNRFSLVTSGRKPSPKQITQLCDTVGQCDVTRPAVLLWGYFNEELRSLYEAGIAVIAVTWKRLRLIFPNSALHIHKKQKLATLDAARRVGMDICLREVSSVWETMKNVTD